MPPKKSKLQLAQERAREGAKARATARANELRSPGRAAAAPAPAPAKSTPSARKPATKRKSPSTTSVATHATTGRKRQRAKPKSRGATAAASDPPDSSSSSSSDDDDDTASVHRRPRGGRVPTPARPRAAGRRTPAAVPDAPVAPRTPGRALLQPAQRVPVIEGTDEPAPVPAPVRSRSRAGPPRQPRSSAVHQPPQVVDDAVAALPPFAPSPSPAAGGTRRSARFNVPPAARQSSAARRRPLAGRKPTPMLSRRTWVLATGTPALLPLVSETEADSSGSDSDAQHGAGGGSGQARGATPTRSRHALTQRDDADDHHVVAAAVDLLRRRSTRKWLTVAGIAAVFALAVIVALVQRTSDNADRAAFARQFAVGDVVSDMYWVLGSHAGSYACGSTVFSTPAKPPSSPALCQSELYNAVIAEHPNVQADILEAAWAKLLQGDIITTLQGGETCVQVGAEHQMVVLGFVMFCVFVVLAMRRRRADFERRMVALLFKEAVETLIQQSQHPDPKKQAYPQLMLLDSLLAQVSSASSRALLKRLWRHVITRVRADRRISVEERVIKGDQYTLWQWVAPTTELGLVADFDPDMLSPFPKNRTPARVTTLADDDGGTDDGTARHIAFA